VRCGKIGANGVARCGGEIRAPAYLPLSSMRVVHITAGSDESADRIAPVTAGSSKGSDTPGSPAASPTSRSGPSSSSTRESMRQASFGLFLSSSQTAN
jgi:hypothetical protein